MSTNIEHETPATPEARLATLEAIFWFLGEYVDTTDRLKESNLGNVVYAKLPEQVIRDAVAAYRKLGGAT